MVTPGGGCNARTWEALSGGNVASATCTQCRTMSHTTCDIASIACTACAGAFQMNFPVTCTATLLAPATQPPPRSVPGQCQGRHTMGTCHTKSLQSVPGQYQDLSHGTLLCLALVETLEGVAPRYRLCHHATSTCLANTPVLYLCCHSIGICLMIRCSASPWLRRWRVSPLAWRAWPPCPCSTRRGGSRPVHAGSRCVGWLAGPRRSPMHLLCSAVRTALLRCVCRMCELVHPSCTTWIYVNDQ